MKYLLLRNGINFQFINTNSIFEKPLKIRKIPSLKYSSRSFVNPKIHDALSIFKVTAPYSTLGNNEIINGLDQRRKHMRLPVGTNLVYKSYFGTSGKKLMSMF